MKTRKEIVTQFCGLASQLTGIPDYVLDNAVLERLIPLFQELWDYRNNVIQSKDVDDTLVSDIIALCQMIVKSEKPVSQLRLAQSLLERMEK